MKHIAIQCACKSEVIVRIPDGIVNLTVECPDCGQSVSVEKKSPSAAGTANGR